MKPFSYVDFYDVPRIIIVYSEPTYVLECRFDEEKDDYPDFYDVFLIRNYVEGNLQGYWWNVDFNKELLCKVKVSEVKFDPSLRKTIDMSFLENCP